MRLFILNAVGGFVVLLGWVGISGTARLSHQFAWLSLAVCGFLAAAVGNGVWLLAGRRTVGRRMQALTDLEAFDPSAGSVITERDAKPHRPVDPSLLVAPPAATRFHRPGCILVRDKELQEAGLSEHRRKGRVACEVCQP